MSVYWATGIITCILNSDYNIKLILTYLFLFIVSSERQPTEVKLHFGNNTDLNVRQEYKNCLNKQVLVRENQHQVMSRVCPKNSR